MKKRNLDYIVETLEDFRFDENLINGIVFFLACRLSFCRDEDLKNEQVDSQEFITNRYYSFFDLDDIPELNSRPLKVPIIPVIEDLIECFQSFAFYMDFYMEEDRVSESGRSTHAFDKCKHKKYLNDEEAKENFKLFHINEIYTNFFISLGDVLKLVTSNYREVFAFADKFITYSVSEDPVGFSRVVNNGLKVVPPIYTTILDLYFHQMIYDENGLRDDRSPPFQLTLQGFMNGMPHEMADIVWNLQRILFFNQETLEQINTEFQFLNIREAEQLYKHFENEVIEKNKEYFESIKPQFSNEHTSFLESYTNNGKETSFEFIYRKIFEVHGLSPDRDYSNPTRQTYFAIFFFYLVCYSVSNA